MTKFTGPLNVGPWQSETNNVTINPTGTVAYSGLSGLVVVDAETTSGAAGGTAGTAVPSSCEAYLTISVNGSNYRLAMYKTS